MSESGYFEDRAPRPHPDDLQRAQRRRRIEDRQAFDALMSSIDPLYQMNREMEALERRVALQDPCCRHEGGDS